MKMRIHTRTSKIIGRLVVTFTATALAFSMLGTSALAAAPVVRDQIASSSAGAAKEVCGETICTSTSVFVIVNGPDGRSEACLNITRYDKTEPKGTPLDFETGCAPLASGAFSIDTKGLASATLAPVDITLEAYACGSAGCEPTGATRPAHVSATYTGIGQVSAFRSNGKSTFGGCTMWFAGKGSSRDATAILTVGTQSLDARGSLFASTQKLKVTCR
jgi:hypothetical protein